ncbi:MAG: hypothetical protein EXR72_20265 [Myxococcales bacterium]|nr:hypothetical protein [Myxococcales bacterium]
MEDILVPISLFMMPVLIVAVVQYFKAVRDGKLGPMAKGNTRELEGLREERKLLEARVQNLESVVCSVDLELNTRMNKMLARESAIRALSPPSLVAPPPLRKRRAARWPTSATCRR